MKIEIKCYEVIGMCFFMLFFLTVQLLSKIFIDSDFCHGFLHTNQCNVDKHSRVSDARHSGFAMRIGLECGFILKDDISQS